MRVEVATGAIRDDITTEEMGMVEETGMLEDIIGMIEHEASRCNASYPSTNAIGKYLSVCATTKWCTILPL